MTTPTSEFLASSDERILYDILRQLVWQSDIDTHDLRVEVANGTVHLRGAVETCMEIVEAEHAAKAVFGVTKVFNHLDVAPRRPRSDSEIREELIAALRHSNSILDEQPDVAVRQGVAVLHGHCRWSFQRTCAERTALSTIGVRRVINLMTTDPNSNSRTSTGFQTAMHAARCAS